MKKIDDMTDEQLEKRTYVRRHLRGIMKTLDSSIVSLQYKVTDEDHEFVIITRSNSYKKLINVTGCSLFAITRDVVGSLCI